LSEQVAGFEDSRPANCFLVWLYRRASQPGIRFSHLQITDGNIEFFRRKSR
jgi:hypothetical protein